MREFNTSGPNISKQHYTLERTKQLEQGKTTQARLILPIT